MPKIIQKKIHIQNYPWRTSIEAQHAPCFCLCIDRQVIHHFKRNKTCISKSNLIKLKYETKNCTKAHSCKQFSFYQVLDMTKKNPDSSSYLCINCKYFVCRGWKTFIALTVVHDLHDLISGVSVKQFKGSLLKLFVTLDLRSRPHLNSESHLWSEGLQCSETLHKQPVTLEHNHIKQQYGRCSVVYIWFSKTQTFRLSSFVFLSPWNTGLKNNQAQLCSQRNIWVLSLTGRRQIEVSSLDVHTYSLSLSLSLTHTHTHTAWVLPLL